MSKPRSVSVDIAYPLRKDAEGNHLCRWCGATVKPPRRSYCSKQCSFEVEIRTSASALRYHLKQRDHGICAQCGIDTLRLKRIFNHAERAYYEILYGIGSTGGWWVPQHARMVFSVLTRMGFNAHSSLWEADHIKEVINGGDSSLDNMQTLCVPCHKAKTKKMHQDRKFERTGVRPKQPVRETQIRLI